VLQKPAVSTVLRLGGQQPLGQTTRYQPTKVRETVCVDISFA